MVSSSASATRRPRWGRRVALVCLALVVVIITAIGWVLVRGLLAKAELEAIVPLTQTVRAAAADRDIERLDELVPEIQHHAARAASLTSDPLWAAAEAIPFAGPNLAAVRVVSASIDRIASTAEPLVAMARDLRAGAASGSVVQVLGEAHVPLQQAAEAFSDARRELSGLPGDGVLAPVERGIATTTRFVEEGTPVIDAMAEASTILPPMLGADGPRTLLVMLQNEAELRTSGGLAGSFVLLAAAADGFDIVQQADSSKFPRRAESIAELPGPIQDLFGDDVGRYVQNATMSPDFALTGALVSDWWSGYTGTAPDAVLSIDLSVVSALIAATGPLVLPDGSQIPADELVQRVLVEPYFTLDAEQQTAFQEVVTAAAMQRILGPGSDPIAWVEALLAPVGEGRVSAWSSVADEQAAIETSPLGGPAARHAAAVGDAYAVYFNDATAGKMDSFLAVDIGTGSTACRSDGRYDVTVAVTLTNTAPAEARAWPILVTGGGSQGVAPGDISTDVAVAAPPGTFLGEVLRDGAPVIPADAEVAGFPTIRAGSTIAPGQSSVLTFRFVSGDAREPELSILHTPLLVPPTASEFDVTCG